MAAESVFPLMACGFFVFFCLGAMVFVVRTEIQRNQAWRRSYRAREILLEYHKGNHAKVEELYEQYQRDYGERT